MDRVVTGRGFIESVLADPGFEVVPVPEGETGLAWLRSSVCRFTNGEVHARRRALIEGELEHLDPAALRADAGRRTTAILGVAGGHLDVMREVARPVPMATLCAALGVAGDHLAGAATDAALVGRGYLTGNQDPEVDAAVDRLAAQLERGGPEEAAAALAVLAQACEATAALIGNALVLSTERSDLRADIGDLVQETLRTAPPLRVMRRVSPEGDGVLLDLEAASGEGGPADRPSQFGSGIRPCPGQAEALALAEGVIDALVSHGVVVDGDVTYANSPAFRLPERIVVTVS
jgi:cytochrome P450